MDLSLDPNTQGKVGCSVIPGPEGQAGERFLVCLFVLHLFCVVKGYGCHRVPVQRSEDKL